MRIEGLVYFYAKSVSGQYLFREHSIDKIMPGWLARGRYRMKVKSMIGLVLVKRYVEIRI